MKQILALKITSTADHYQEAADLIELHATTNNNGGLSWVACINATLAVEIYLKSFLATQVFTPTESDPYAITEEFRSGHDLFQLYEKIDPQTKSLILAASLEINSDIELVEVIEHCKDYFFNARYSYESKSLKCLNSEIIILARHMKKVVKKITETEHP